MSAWFVKACPRLVFQSLVLFIAMTVCTLPERHLGLTPVTEVDPTEAINTIREAVEKWLSSINY